MEEGKGLKLVKKKEKKREKKNRVKARWRAAAQPEQKAEGRGKRRVPYGFYWSAEGRTNAKGRKKGGKGNA